MLCQMKGLFKNLVKSKTNHSIKSHVLITSVNVANAPVLYFTIQLFDKKCNILKKL